MSKKLSEVYNNFARQAEFCKKLGSPFYAQMLPEISDLCRQSEFMTQVFTEWQGNPRTDAIALRFTAALNYLVLTGQADALKGFFPPSDSQPNTARELALKECIEEHKEFIAGYLERPPQTNEVGRCMALIGGFLEVAQLFGGDMDILEIGASAGLNLFFDQYYYHAYDWSWGNSDSVLKFNLEWRGPPPPLNDIRVINRKACDRSPIDIENEENRLLSYVWPDQSQRLARLKAAIEQISTTSTLSDADYIGVDQSEASIWLNNEAKKVPVTRARVIYHSIVLQYFSDNERIDFLNTIEDIGNQATSASPLAWLRLEPAPNNGNAELRLTTWPNKRDCLLAESSFHGDWVHWFAVNNDKVVQHNMKIRAYQSADQQQAIKLWQDVGLATPQNDPMKDIQRKLLVNPELFLVAIKNEQILGTAMGGYEGHRGWVNYLAVAPTARRQGIATRLMRELEVLLKAQGCPKINLQVRDTNRQALEFYAALGYADDHVIGLGKRLKK